MSTQEFSASANPTVVVNAKNDLTVMGWDEPRVAVDFDDPGDANQEENVIKIRTRGDCKISMPRGGSLLVERAGDDARIEQITGGIQVRGVGSDLRLRDVGEVVIDAIGDSLDARGVTGSVVARSVGGSATLQRVNGNVAITGVGGSVETREVAGRYIGVSVGGSLRLNDVELSGSISIGGSGEFRMNPLPGERVQISAGGSINCQLPEDANAIVEISDGRGARQMRLGTGASAVALSAGGSVAVRSKAFASQPQSGAPNIDFDLMFNKLEDAFDTMGSSFDRFGEGLGHLGSMGERIADRARRTAERAGEKARRRAEKEVARAQRLAEREVERAARRGTGWSWSWSSPATPATPAAPAMPAIPASPRRAAAFESAEPAPEPVSDKERMSILRMVEQKKITIQQAEQLLRALDG